jgi:hypothetical protein
LFFLLRECFWCVRVQLIECFIFVRGIFSWIVLVSGYRCVCLFILWWIFLTFPSFFLIFLESSSILQIFKISSHKTTLFFLLLFFFLCTLLFFKLN